MANSRKKAALTILCIIVILSTTAIYINYLSERRHEETAQRKANIRRLVGFSEAKVRVAMRKTGLVLRSEINNDRGYESALCRIQPQPRIHPRGLVLYYSDEAKLVRQCAFIYFDKNDHVFAVHVADEMW